MLSHLIGYHNLVVEFFQTFGLCESGVPLCHLITVSGIGKRKCKNKICTVEFSVHSCGVYSTFLTSLQYIPVEFTVHSCGVYRTFMWSWVHSCGVGVHFCGVYNTFLWNLPYIPVKLGYIPVELGYILVEFTVHYCGV